MADGGGEGRVESDDVRLNIPLPVAPTAWIDERSTAMSPAKRSGTAAAGFGMIALVGMCLVLAAETWPMMVDSSGPEGILAFAGFMMIVLFLALGLGFAAAAVYLLRRARPGIWLTIAAIVVTVAATAPCVAGIVIRSV